MIQTPKQFRIRLHPEQKLSPEEIEQRQIELKTFRDRCKIIFDSLRSELMKTHDSWYVAIEPDSGDYFLAPDELDAAKICREKHPNAVPHVFCINETGFCGRV